MFKPPCLVHVGRLAVRMTSVDTYYIGFGRRRSATRQVSGSGHSIGFGPADEAGYYIGPSMVADVSSSRHVDGIELIFANGDDWEPATETGLQNQQGVTVDLSFDQALVLHHFVLANAVPNDDAEALPPEPRGAV